MRSVYALFVLLLLGGCCTPPPPQEVVQACPCTESAAAVEQKVEPEPVAMPATIEEAVVEGFVVCERDSDVRIIGVRELGDAKCLLIYDNRLSGNGTQNILPNTAACELQQLRMKQNFVRAGFACR